MGEYDCNTGKVKPSPRIFDFEAEQLLTDFLSKQKVMGSRVVKQNAWLAEIVEQKVALSRAEIIKAMVR